MWKDTSEGQLHVLAPAGIGDLAWIFSKWRTICQERNVTFWFPKPEQKRAAPLAHMYGAKAGYLDHLTTEWVWHGDPKGYHVLWSPDGQPDIPDTGAVLVVQPNGHLEKGKHIRSWYPDLPFLNPAPESKAAILATLVGCPQYIVAFMCHYGYMGGNMMPGTWAQTFELIEKHIAPIQIVAAGADVPYAEKVCEIFLPSLSPCLDAPLPEVCTILKNAKAMIGVASGISILSTYYGIPTISAYPRHLAAMPGTWEHPYANTAACFVDQIPFVGLDLLSQLLSRAPHLLGSANGTGRGDVETVPEPMSEVHDTGSDTHQQEEAAVVVGESSSNGHGVSVAPWLVSPGVRTDTRGGR